MNNQSVFSYLRFSSPAQAKGTSVDRQLDYAKRWAAENGMTLDASLTMRDEGLSAFHQRHVKQGALGTFLRAIEDGKVPPGSVLVVEGLDRLSRAEPMLAQGQLSSIIGAGIRVITAADGREYSRETLKADPMGHVYSLLTMIRAHEESDTKSKRVRAAMRRKCEQWLAGTYRGPIGGTQNNPAWIELTPDGYRLRPERALAMRTMIDLYMQGYGSLRVVEELNRRGLSLSGGPNGVDRVRQLIVKRTLMGEKEVTIKGETYVLPGYFPALLTEIEFAELQVITEQRGRRHGKGEIPGIFTGLGIAVCGYCGRPLVAQNGVKRGRRPDGLPHDGHRRLVCTAVKNAGGIRCPVGGSCSVVPVENALMTFCADAMNLSRLVAGDSGQTTRIAILAKSRAAAAQTEAQIAKLMDAMLADPDAMPAAFARKVRELEDRLKDEKVEVARHERELAAVGTAKPADARAWATLLEGVQRLDFDARTKARQLVADSFSRIAVYRQGFSSTEDDGTIGMLLVGKRGSTRMLSINRRTAGWTASADVDMSNGLPLPPSVVIGD